FLRSISHEGRKQLEWLGATSMPAASAEASVSSLDAFSIGANGLGLGIGSGFEWPAFAARLGRGQMVYIYEPQAALLRMALELADCSALLQQRKIILLHGTPDQAGERLVAILQSLPGIEPPTVLHP